MAQARESVAVLGGTGALGNALATRWALAGHHIIIGSRAAERAAQAAVAMNAVQSGLNVSGAGNAQAAQAADVVVLTVPFAHQAPTLAAIQANCAGKLVVDTTVPLMPPKVGTVQLPAPGCAALIAQAALGETASVCSAFHNVAAEKLAAAGDVECDVLVFGDKLNDRKRVIELAQSAGLRGIHGGPLANSAAAEALTSVLIGINRRYNVPGAGIRITGNLIDPDA